MENFCFKAVLFLWKVEKYDNVVHITFHWNVYLTLLQEGVGLIKQVESINKYNFHFRVLECSEFMQKVENDL